VVRWRAAGGRRAARRGESGHALLLALLVLFMMAVALDLLASSLALKLRLMNQESRTLHLIALTDAELAETLAALSLDRDFPGFADHAYAGGVIGSVVTPTGVNRCVVVAQARFRGGDRAVSADVRLAADGPHVATWRRVPWSALPP
jgi:hypothetical protein